VDIIEGREITNSDLYNYGSLKLRILNGKPNDKIKILLNGNLYGYFLIDEVVIKVKDYDVVQIDTTEINENIEIGIEPSENIVLQTMQTRVKLYSNLRTIARIRISK
jgi:hypothetical protein